MASRYRMYSGPMVTTAKPAVTSLSAGVIKTILQIATPATSGLTVVEWGVGFDASAAGVPGSVELIETNVAATVTAAVAAGVQPDNLEATIAASLMTLGTSATGYNATAEGSITATRMLDGPKLVAPTNSDWKQFPLGREAQMSVSKFLRIRCQFAAAVGVLGYVVWEE